MKKTKSTRRGVSHTPIKKRAAVARKPAITKQKRRETVSSRRPEVNEVISFAKVERLIQATESLKEQLEMYAAHMRALDRKRLNGVGVKKQGFIENAYEFAEVNPEFLPHWVPLEKYENDIELFRGLRTLFDINKQVGELLWNLVMQASDMAYTDTLEFYASVREAARRRVDAAETIHNELMKFFSRSKNREDEPTENEIRRDMNALLRGRKDGKVVVENINPKVERGSRKLVDKTFKAKSSFKDIENGEIED